MTAERRRKTLRASDRTSFPAGGPCDWRATGWLSKMLQLARSRSFPRHAHQEGARPRAPHYVISDVAVKSLASVPIGSCEIIGIAGSSGIAVPAGGARSPRRLSTKPKALRGARIRSARGIAGDRRRQAVRVTSEELAGSSEEPRVAGAGETVTTIRTGEAKTSHSERNQGLAADRLSNPLPLAPNRNAVQSRRRSRLDGGTGPRERSGVARERSGVA